MKIFRIPTEDSAATEAELVRAEGVPPRFVLTCKWVRYFLEGMKRDIVMARLQEALPRLRDRYPLRDLALFGSVARQEESPESDVDLLVDVDPSIGLRFVDLSQDLENILGMPVDAVSSRGLSPAQRANIQKDLLHVG